MRVALVPILIGAACDVPPAQGPKLELRPGAAPAFARAWAPRPFVLPDDHGPHYDFQTEWWYYTGQLLTPAARRFGFQLTFFRRGLSPGAPPAGPGLATNQVYFAHFALTDVAAGQHRFAERWARGAGSLAGASPQRVFLEDWTATSLVDDGSRLALAAKDGELGIDLTLRAEQPLVAHGERGLSPKSDEPGNASYYVGYPRLHAQGTVTVGATPLAVAGQAWFDHEWSTSALGPQAVGWDWFSLQLDDGRELMCFRIRRKDGTLEPASSGTLIDRDGTPRRLAAADVEVDVQRHWRSAASGGNYPAAWRLRVPSAGLDLGIEPWIADQELRASFTYWEGAVRVTGTSGGRPIAGQGYVELTGYAATMQGVF